MTILSKTTQAEIKRISESQNRNENETRILNLSNSINKESIKEITKIIRIEKQAKREKQISDNAKYKIDKLNDKKTEQQKLLVELFYKKNKESEDYKMIESILRSEELLEELENEKAKLDKIMREDKAKKGKRETRAKIMIATKFLTMANKNEEYKIFYNELIDLFDDKDSEFIKANT